MTEHQGLAGIEASKVFVFGLILENRGEKPKLVPN